MTITVSVKTYSHRAKIQRTGYDDVVIGPDVDSEFVAYPGLDIIVSEVVEETGGGATTQGGGGGHPTPPD